MTDEAYTPETLRRYLLGALPAGETERLDELSITDESVAEALSVAEDDLFDEFVRGDLQGPALEEFRARFLSTPHGRERVQFSEALRTWTEPAAAGRSRWAPRMITVAAAAAVALVAGTWLAVQNVRLRDRIAQLQTANDSLRQAPAVRAPETAAPPAPAAAVAMLLLTPPLRSSRALPALAVPPGVADVPIQLALEPVDFPAYRVDLLDAADRGAAWQSDRLTATPGTAGQTLSIRVPAPLLTAGTHTLRVSGLTAAGRADLVSDYSFRVVR